jgi:uncharacterized protein YaiE (UPF0345 family)
MIFKNADITREANIHHGGSVTSRSMVTANGEHKTLGFMQEGTFKFNTKTAEMMEVVHGECRVRLQNSDDWHFYEEGQTFNVPANSSFDIEVADFLDYICHLASDK